MELTPPSGRPPKDPEERRSETVYIRLCPSRKKLIRIDANRRSTSMTAAVVRIGFEEIQPSGRRVPEPVVWEWIRDLADQLHANAEREHEAPTIEMRDLKKEIRSKAKEVTERGQKLTELWSVAREETRDEILGVRLTPGRYEWLGRRAKEQETGRSSLLRARALEGIVNRCWLLSLNEQLDRWADKTAGLNFEIYQDGGGDEVKSDLKDLAREVDHVVDDREQRL